MYACSWSFREVLSRTYRSQVRTPLDRSLEEDEANLRQHTLEEATRIRLEELNGDPTKGRLNLDRVNKHLSERNPNKPAIVMPRVVPPFCLVPRRHCSPLDQGPPLAWCLPRSAQPCESVWLTRSERLPSCSFLSVGSVLPLSSSWFVLFLPHSTWCSVRDHLPCPQGSPSPFAVSRLPLLF